MDSCVHIYCGDGKGKTTAAVGLAVRAAGCGRKVLITRFLKTDHSGEVAALGLIPGITVTPCEKSFGFTFRMTEEQKKEAAVYYTALLDRTLKKAAKGGYHMLVLDEIMAVMNCGLVQEETVRAFITGRPSGLEVVMTGREPSEELISLADYVSEIRKVKHPYDQGISAREGIEF